MRRLFARPYVLSALALATFAAPRVVAAPSAASGWEHLRHNRNVEARAAFRAALKQNPSNPEALRGLGLLNLQEDAGVAALQAWRRSTPSRRPTGRRPPTGRGWWSLDISTVPSWRHIVEWYRDLSGPLCVPDAAIRRKAEELTRNAKTEEEKLRAIVALVAREIQYQTVPFRMSAYVPTEGRQVLRERYGDCKDKAALLTALLAAAGIRADIALLSPRSEGIVPSLPSPRCSHAVVRVETSQGPLWIDATADQSALGDFPYECQQVPALVIHEATTDLRLTPALPAEANRVVQTHTGVLGADGGLTGSVEYTVSGEYAGLLRSGLRLVPEAQRDEALRALASRMLEGARYESGSMEHVADPDRPLSLRFRYRAERHGTPAGDLLLARLPWRWGERSTIEALSAGPPRRQDLEVPPCAAITGAPSGWSCRRAAPRGTCRRRSSATPRGAHTASPTGWKGTPCTPRARSGSRRCASPRRTAGSSPRS